MKKKSKKIIIAVTCIVIIFAIIILNIDTRESIENSGDSTYTLMVYMCASDLESEGGYATDDISEMLDATVDSKINLIIETGGTTQWQKYGISSTTNQIYKVENGKLKLIEDNLGIQLMTEENTLENFIDYGKNNYPADKYGLILWDHGGGSISGYGHDENSQNEDDTLTLDKLKGALNKSNMKFDFIGFDACLMANIETAYSLKENANYLVASEESEPGTGWDYTKFLNKLSSNTSNSMEDIGKTIVDSFIDSNSSEDDPQDATLSVINLIETDNVYNKLLSFMAEVKSKDLDNQNFAYISKAVGEAKSYGDGECDLIDLKDFTNKVNNSKSKVLEDALDKMIVYSKNTSTVKNSNGLSIYFPYKDLEYYQKMLEIYPKIGIDSNYTNTLTEFVNLLVGGKNNSYELNSHTYQTENNYSQYGWYNQSVINQNQQYYNENKYDNELAITNKGDYYALELSDQDWKNIVSITCEVLYDDEGGYIDLGSDNYYESDDDNNLKIGFDGTWISINGQTVPFYVTETDDNMTKGKIPAYLNDEEVNLIVVWNEKNPDGKVLGAEPVNEYGNTTLDYKGLKEIKKGDKIQFLFDYYKYDGSYDDSYIVGDTLNVDDPNLKVSYEDVGEGKYNVYYKITDIYGNTYYTEPVEFE